MTEPGYFVLFLQWKCVSYLCPMLILLFVASWLYDAISPTPTTAAAKPAAAAAPPVAAKNLLQYPKKAMLPTMRHRHRYYYREPVEAKKRQQRLGQS